MQEIPDNFWSTGWGCAPSTIDGMQLHSFVSDEQVCTALGELQKNQEGVSAKKIGTGVFLTVDGKGTNHDLPSLREYRESVSLIELFEKRYRDNEWNLMAYGLHRHSYAMWQFGAQIRNQVDKDSSSRPTGRTDIDAFVGRYSATFAGIHTDFAHNFAFTLSDGKTMHVMSPRSFLLYDWEDEAYYRESHPLIYKTDNLCYFPHDYFHCATTSDAVSFNVNIAIWESAYIVEGNSPDHTGGLYNSFVDSYTQLLIDQPYMVVKIPDFAVDKLGEKLVIRALKQISAFGMEVKTPPPVTLGIQNPSLSRIILAQIGGSLRMFANGHVLKLNRTTLPSSNELKAWILSDTALTSYLDQSIGIKINA